MAPENDTHDDVVAIKMCKAGTLTWTTGDVLLITGDDAYVMPGAAWSLVQRLPVFPRDAGASDPAGAARGSVGQAGGTRTKATTPGSQRRSGWSRDKCPDVQLQQVPLLVALVDLAAARGGTVRQWEMMVRLHPLDVPGFRPRISDMIKRGYCKSEHVELVPGAPPVRILSPTQLGKRLVEVHGAAMREWIRKNRPDVSPEVIKRANGEVDNSAVNNTHVAPPN